MAHYAQLIANIVEMSGYKTFLELGVWTGTVSDAVKPFAKITGVDIVDRRNDKSGEFFLGTTDAFFCQLSEERKWDAIFIDAQHDFESVKKDFKNSFEHLTTNGLLIFHDTDPADPKFYKDCGDVYKIREYIYHWLTESITLPIQDGGMTLCKAAFSRRHDAI